MLSLDASTPAPGPEPSYQDLLNLMGEEFARSMEEFEEYKCICDADRMLACFKSRRC